jgi:hypothetical protein
MNIDDGDDPKVRRKSLKMEMWVKYFLGGNIARRSSSSPQRRRISSDRFTQLRSLKPRKCRACSYPAAPGNTFGTSPCAKRVPGPPTPLARPARSVVERYFRPALRFVPARFRIWRVNPKRTQKRFRFRKSEILGSVIMRIYRAGTTGATGAFSSNCSLRNTSELMS